MGSAIRFRQIEVPRQVGENGRLKVVKGPDYGSIFVLLGSKATIGRGQECDVMLSDLKASRVHAALNYEPKIGWSIKDLKSSNGISINAQSKKESLLILGDVISLGETFLEFVSPEAGTKMLVAPPRALSELEEEYKKNRERQEKVRAMGLATHRSAEGKGGSRLKGGRLLIYAVIGVVFLLLLVLSNEPNNPLSKKKKEDQTDLEKYLPSGEVNRSSEVLFRDGFREYINGNYNRARIQFETALQIDPSNSLSSIYLRNCEMAIQNEVKMHLDEGKRAFDAGKLREAKAHFDRVMRLLYRAKSDPGFIEAQEQYEKVVAEIKNSLFR